MSIEYVNNPNEVASLLGEFYQGECLSCKKAGFYKDKLLVKKWGNHFYDTDRYMIRACCKVALAIDKFHAHRDNKEVIESLM